MFLLQLSPSTLLLSVLLQLAWATQFDDSPALALDPKLRATYLHRLSANPAARQHRLSSSHEVEAAERRVAAFPQRLEHSAHAHKTYIRLPGGGRKEPARALLDREPLMMKWRKEAAGLEMSRADEAAWAQAAMLREKHGRHPPPAHLGRSQSLPHGVLAGVHHPQTHAEKDRLRASWAHLHREATHANHARLGGAQLGQSVAGGFGAPPPRSHALNDEWKAFYKQQAQVHAGLRAKGLDPHRMSDAQWSRHAPVEHRPDDVTRREYFRKQERLAGMGDPGRHLPVGGKGAEGKSPEGKEGPAGAPLGRAKSVGGEPGDKKPLAPGH